MENRGKGKSITIALTALLLVFYCVIMEYILFGIVHIYTSKNFAVGMTFETIGMLLLLLLILGNIIRKENIKLGFFIPMILCTIVYTVVLNYLNILGIITMGSAAFFLAHMVLLFVYLVIVVPMYIMGKQ